MKRHVAITLLTAVVFMIQPLAAQNLVPNGGFEQGILGQPSSQAEIAKCDGWESVNTPDWYSTNSGLFGGCYSPTGANDGACWQNVNPSMSTPDGSEFYAGFASCELIQTQLLSGIPSGSLSRVSFWWSPRTKKDTKIRAYLLPNKIPPGALDNCANPSISAARAFVVDVNTEGALPDHVPGQWYHYVSPWLSTEQANWFAAKGDNQSVEVGDWAYVYIDNVVVEAFTSQGACNCRDYLVQNTVYSGPDNELIAESYIIAGTNVGAGPPYGPVVVSPGAELLYTAGDVIELKDGFAVSGQFQAVIQPCNRTGAITITHTPNVFTPNGDGANDLLVAKANNAIAANVQIFDIWGVKAHEDNFISVDNHVAILWDGVRLNGQPADDGTYYVVLEFCNTTHTVDVTYTVYLVR